MPFGAGRIMFSGVLDAWRYRGDDDEAFASFWRSQLGREAARAPRRLEVTLDPAAAPAGRRVRLRAVVRATDLDVTATAVTTPAVSARVVDERGDQQLIRMWPTAETGVFEGWFDAARPGPYDVRVETDANAGVDAPFVVTAPGPGTPAVDDDGRQRAIAQGRAASQRPPATCQPLVRTPPRAAP